MTDTPTGNPSRLRNGMLTWQSPPIPAMHVMCIVRIRRSSILVPLSPTIGAMLAAEGTIMTASCAEHVTHVATDSCHFGAC